MTDTAALASLRRRTSTSRPAPCRHSGSVWCWGRVAQDGAGMPSLRPVKIDLPGRTMGLKQNATARRLLARNDEGRVYVFDGRRGIELQLGSRRIVDFSISNDETFVCADDGEVVVISHDHLSLQHPGLVRACQRRTVRSPRFVTRGRC